MRYRKLDLDWLPENRWEAHTGDGLEEKVESISEKIATIITQISVPGATGLWPFYAGTHAKYRNKDLLIKDGTLTYEGTRPVWVTEVRYHGNVVYREDYRDGSFMSITPSEEWEAKLDEAYDAAIAVREGRRIGLDLGLDALGTEDKYKPIKDSPLKDQSEDDWTRGVQEMAWKHDDKAYQYWLEEQWDKLDPEGQLEVLQRSTVYPLKEQ